MKWRYCCAPEGVRGESKYPTARPFLIKPRRQLNLMPKASVIICTHNPRPHYLRRVLEALRGQSLPLEQWELLLIDNASTLDLLDDISWHPNGRRIKEPKMGLAFARVRGFRSASAPLFILVDDDNELSSDYLTTALRISDEWPILGTWGSGTIEPEFEAEPPATVKPFLNYLALRKNDRAYWGNIITRDESLPVGAGLCVRSHVAARYANEIDQSGTSFPDRQGSQLFGGGDYELCFTGCTMGLGMAVFPELELRHLIPASRVSEQHMARLVGSTMVSLNLLDYKWTKKAPVRPLAPGWLLHCAVELLSSRGFERKMKIFYIRSLLRARRFLQVPLS
jgi:Glycosyl transferase family 2